MIDNKIETKSYITPKSRRKRSKHIPIIDLRSVENLLQEKKFKQREKSIDKHEKNLKTRKTRGFVVKLAAFFRKI